MCRAFNIHIGMYALFLNHNVLVSVSLSGWQSYGGERSLQGIWQQEQQACRVLQACVIERSAPLDISPLTIFRARYPEGGEPLVGSRIPIACSPAGTETRPRSTVRTGIHRQWSQYVVPMIRRYSSALTTIRISAKGSTSLRWPRYAKRARERVTPCAFNPRRTL
jgi:hypothetical protein